MFSIFDRVRRLKSTGLGLGLKGGDEHYRAYVGPPEDYDIVAAMAFNLLTCAGLRQNHRLLDIGCGSLRLGRLIIPYLGPGNYVGVEPNKWLVKDGIGNEIGHDLIRLKQPVFEYGTSLDAFKDCLELDYAIAQSIFSHCSEKLIRGWLNDVHRHLKPTGALFATFKQGTVDYAGKQDWIYPATVKYTTDKICEIAVDCGFGCKILDWTHPRQKWVMFYGSEFDLTLLDGDSVSWNNRMRHFLNE